MLVLVHFSFGSSFHPPPIYTHTASWLWPVEYAQNRSLGSVLLSNSLSSNLIFQPKNMGLQGLSVSPMSQGSEMAQLEVNPGLQTPSPVLFPLITFISHSSPKIKLVNPFLVQKP